MAIHAPPQGSFKGVIGKGTHRFTRFIAAGGEGQVYHLDSHGPGGEPLAGKVYGNNLTRSKIKKLNYMIALATPELRSISAWPVDILATRGNKVIGFAMPLVTGGTPLHLLRTPKTRLAKMPNLSYTQLVHVSENVARAVTSLHQAGIVIGDINGQNFLVGANGTIRAIDCDSMQVGSKSDWASGVGVEEYIAPELQGRSLKGVIRTPNHDAFALAVLIFELLVLGRHPFGGHASLTIAEAIKKRAHIFSRNSPKPTVFDVTGLKPKDLLSPELVKLFTCAFGSTTRPTASDWGHALQCYRQQLQPCKVNGNHAIPASARRCPWCAMEKKKLPSLFAHKPYRPTRTANSPPSTPAKPAAQQSAQAEVQQATARPAPSRKTSLQALTLSVAGWVLKAVFRIVWWVLRSFLNLLLTPVSTTRAVTLRLIRTAVTTAINYVTLVIQSMIQLLTQAATVLGHAIAVSATIVWNGTRVIATIVFNICLILGTLYGILWIIREFITSIF